MGGREAVPAFDIPERLSLFLSLKRHRQTST